MLPVMPSSSTHGPDRNKQDPSATKTGIPFRFPDAMTFQKYWTVGVRGRSVQVTPSTLVATYFGSSSLVVHAIPLQAELAPIAEST